MADDLTQELAPGEQAIVAEVITRDWASRKQVDNTIESILARRSEGPIHRALLTQHLINKQQFERLEELLHKDLVVDEFQVDRRLGSGAMGDVFLAHHQDDGTQVALKLINKRYADDDQFVKRFEREIEALRGLEHPTIAAAVGYGKHDGLPYLAMEYVPGPSLAKLLDDHGPLPETYVLRLAEQVAQGLEYVYEQTELVHRDIKPDNILTVPGEQDRGDLFERLDSAKLIDFGLARSYTNDERLTMTGITMGTPHYMSPEQIRGSQDVDQRSDIYGLGATMYHLLTGKTPYEGSSPGAVMTAHLTEPTPDPKAVVPALSADTRELVMMAMAKDPADRFLSYSGFLKACQDALVAQGAGENNMRLLRKPMVINKGKQFGRKPGGPAADRASKNSRQAPEGESKPEHAGAHRPTPPGTAKTDAFTGADRAASSSGIKPPSSNRRRRRETSSSDEFAIPETDHVTRRHEATERLVKEMEQTHGIAILPLMVLGVALVALAAILVWRFL